MPRFIIRPHKQVGTVEWSNVYTVEAANLAAAVVLATPIINAERAVSRNWVNFTVCEIEPQGASAGQGTIITVSQIGQLSAGAGRLPLESCVRVVFRPAAGKPSMKWLRGVCAEDDQELGVLGASIITPVTNLYLNVLLDLDEYVDVDGQAFTGGHVVPTVANRQLKRRRRSRPGFKRGWVPA